MIADWSHPSWQLQLPGALLLRGLEGARRTTLGKEKPLSLVDPQSWVVGDFESLPFWLRLTAVWEVGQGVPWCLDDAQACKLKPAKHHFPHTLKTYPLLKSSYKSLSTSPRIHFGAWSSFLLQFLYLLDLPASKSSHLHSGKPVIPFYMRARNNGTGKTTSLPWEAEGNDANQAQSPETVARIHRCWVAKVTEPWKGFHKLLIHFNLFLFIKRLPRAHQDLL